MSCYIASPFFNSEQLALVEKIEDTFERANAPFFSPRKIGVLKPNSGTKDRDAILKGNIDALTGASCVLAVFDYLLPAYQSVQLSSDRQPSMPLFIPDSGVVWESAFAFANQIPVVGFVVKAPQLNVMISQTLRGVVTSLVELSQFAQTWNGERFHYSILKPWQGKTQ